jgi:alpha-glucosidase
LRRLKAKYDGVKLLAGYPGSHAAILRWAGEGGQREWILGCVTNGSRALDLSLDFLPPGAFEAEIYGDTRMGNEITYEKRQVDQHTRLELVMPDHGGAGVYIAEKIQPLAPYGQEGYLCGRRRSLPAKDARLLHGSELLTLSETKTAVLLNGGARFTLTDTPESKVRTLRVFYSAERPCTLELWDGQASRHLYLPGNVAPGVFTAAETSLPVPAGFSTLTLRKVSGDAPVLLRVDLIDNNPSLPHTLRAEDGIVSGGAALIPWQDGLYSIAGLGLGGEVMFDTLPARRAGKHIVALHYLAGVDGKALVDVNGTPVPANLGGLGGWGATQRGELLAREILVTLKPGPNTLRVYNDAAALPLVVGVSVRALADLVK